ncbi:MAG: hypothetical protein WKH64_11450 [Chloroflexia bacterium]
MPGPVEDAGRGRVRVRARARQPVGNAARSPARGGRPVQLGPGEEVRYHVEIGALPDAAAIQRFESCALQRT